MVFETFIILVTAMALLYAGIARYLQNKLVDRKEMEDIQAESKRLSEEFKKAQDSKDQRRIDEATKKQLEFLPRMNKMMLSQLKPMFVILAVFFVFTWAVGQIDPIIKDDVRIILLDEGRGCDAKAGDGIYSGCYTLQQGNGSAYGKWVVSGIALNNNAEIGHNYTYFYYNSQDHSDTYLEGPKGEPVSIGTDKLDYAPGETIKIHGQIAKGSGMAAVLDSGTSFYVDLPFPIPIINVQRIRQAYWWFIFISIIANLAMSIGMAIMQKMKGQDQKEKKK